MRSAYLRQVERIAPPRLLDRGPELGELAAFCLQEDRGPYVWWRAGPWAGKSALLSSFVLRPPEPVRAGRVRLISFFITARLADNRDAFVTVLTEQLCALTGQELPTVVGAVQRESIMLELLTQAAEQCRADGGRLVLVVDGSDEDRGVTTGRDAQSIAGLLPREPPAGMRVIVAGRANPPIPDDVRDWHPLRDPGIVRLLGASPHARDLQRLSESELLRLLRGSPLEQDVLGLITAARGGLTGPDLRELTGSDLAEIVTVLHTATGRTFGRQDGYLLGHEELQRTAEQYLEPRMPGYRDRLHTWADTYRDRGWPADTPDYLLRAYFRVLRASDDQRRAAELATDPDRHHRLLDATGGDTVALGEIRAAHQLCLGRPEPDLEAMACLGIDLERIEQRNTNIPAGLPAVWALLGQPVRAEALARSLTDSRASEAALSAVAEVLATAGLYERAEMITESISDPAGRTAAQTAIVAGLVRDGAAGRAAEIAAGVADPAAREQVRAAIAEATALAGDPDGAETAARGLTDRHAAEPVWIAIAGVVAASGDLRRAERIVASPADPRRQALALARIAVTIAARGVRHRAARMIRQAEAAVDRHPDRLHRARLRAELVRAMTTTGSGERAGDLLPDAERIAGTITEPYWRVQALATVAVAMHAGDASARAGEILAGLERAGLEWAGKEGRERAGREPEALLVIAEAAAAIGDRDRAARLARELPEPRDQAGALTAVARALAGAGRPDAAEDLLREAERIARRIDDPAARATSDVEVARALVTLGQVERAERLGSRVSLLAVPEPLMPIVRSVAAAGHGVQAARIANGIVDPELRAEAQVGAVRALIAAGEPGQARQVAARIGRAARRAEAYLAIAVRLALAGEHDQVDRILGGIGNFVLRGEALAALARTEAAAGDRARAEAHLGEAVRILGRVLDPYRRGLLLSAVVQAVIATGDHRRAERMAGEATDPLTRDLAWAGVATGLAAAGECDRAERLLANISPHTLAPEAVAAAMATVGAYPQAERVARGISDPLGRPAALTAIARAMAAAGLIEPAQRIALGLPDPGDRVRALIEIGRAAGRAGAATPLAHAFAIGKWYQPLGAVAELWPELALRIIERYERDRCLMER
ncbi:hypothetical protein [Actinoplanes sp. L3-i22]|uniref:hypothetical protein n=1 Tax=Actinoplanes sp. L3-i22 TaxID=2836373 RepID=UPI001C765C9E|nr:hypothetical protein [Actinoplanes sp. L3-i22]BCY11994.1 hypothetical protein L3i22_070820 [Actinoplanes sp. L3-i22]